MRTIISRSAYRVNALMIAPIAARPGQVLVLASSGVLSTSAPGVGLQRYKQCDAVEAQRLLAQLQEAGVVRLMAFRDDASPPRARTGGTAA